MLTNHLPIELKESTNWSVRMSCKNLIWMPLELADEAPGLIFTLQPFSRKQNGDSKGHG